MKRICFAILSLGVASLAPAGEFPAAARAFISKHCTECHDADSRKDDLDLTALSVGLDDPPIEAKWAYIYDRVQMGEMPPAKKATPPAAERSTFLQSLGGYLAEHDARIQADRGGRVVLRRLNRNEYENTIHDLLGIEHPLADMLPDDGSPNTFDNIAEALRLSSAQIDSYLFAADKALDCAIDLRPDPRMKKRFSFLDEPFIKDLIDQPAGLANPSGTKGARILDSQDNAFLLYINDPGDRTRMRASHVPITGKYRIRASVFAQGGTGHPVPVIRMMADDFRYDRPIGDYDLAPGQTRLLDFPAWMTEGTMIEVSARGLTHVGLDGRQLRDFIGEKFTGPGIGVRWVEVEGPLVETWPPPSVQKIFGDVPIKLMKRRLGPRAYEVAPIDPRQDADRLILDFAGRAFRRPITPKEGARFIALAHEALDQKASFESAIRRAYKAILTSPKFLFLQESAGRLDDYALASRLSYFLWSTSPDDQLLRLAGEGKLHEPAVLHDQTERLLNDPRAHAFTKNFCGQWLNLRAIDATMPDARLYPEFDFMLRDAMVGETEAFFDELLQHDLPARNFIDSDFSMLNRRIAEHYGITGVVGEQFRKVQLPPDCHRGGILTHASVLKVTANGTTSSPVIRGAWVVRRILGRQVQPPPPNAGSIEPDTRGASTIREQLDKHRKLASCASCHQYMDPPGFALENFDVIGGFRSYYRVFGREFPLLQLKDRTTDELFGIRKGPAVDPTGQLSDGRTFSDIDSLKKLLLDKEDVVARNLTNNLITYATGATISFADRSTVDEILQKTKPHSYGLRSLVDEIVQSRLFLMK